MTGYRTCSVSTRADIAFSTGSAVGTRFIRLLAALLAAPLLLAACGDGGSPGGTTATKSQSAAGPGAMTGKPVIPAIDPNAAFPALSAIVFDALGSDVPELARHRDAALSAERDAIRGAIENFRAKTKAAGKKAAVVMPEAANGNRAVAPDAGMFNLIPVAVAAAPSFSDVGAVQQLVVGNNVVLLMGEGIANTDNTVGGAKTVSTPGETSGTVAASMTVSVEKGGPPSAELATKMSIPLLGLDANSKVKITGDLCPSPDGKVDFTIQMSSSGRAGSAGSVIYDQNIEARVTATVGDDANVVNVDYDLKQGTRSTAGGRQVYVESSQSMQLPGGDYASATYGTPRIIRASSQATADDASLSQEGLTRAHYLAIGAFGRAKSFWQSGNCIKIVAASPGTVEPGATSKIPVAVKHKKDGSSVPAKVTAQLSGGASVDPGVIAKAPGDITHVASKERDASMTLALAATSRRGADKLSLEINTKTAAAYQIVGGLDDWKTNTAVCDIMKPFTLTGGGITMQVSGGLSGTYSYTGPFNSHGTGTYTISLPEGAGKPGTMTGGGVGFAMGHSNTGTERYTLTPLKSCG